MISHVKAKYLQLMFNENNLIFFVGTAGDSDKLFIGKSVEKDGKQREEVCCNFSLRKFSIKKVFKLFLLSEKDVDLILKLITCEEDSW